MINKLPMTLVLLRFMLASIVLVMYWYEASPLSYVAILTAAIVSDIFDGILARKLGVATQQLRAMDSMADTCFYLSILIVSLLLHSDLIMPFAIPLITLLFIEAVRYLYDWKKYAKSASYHMWSAKLWGIFLFLGFCQLLGSGEAGVFFQWAVYIGIATNIEGLLASILLPQWRCDVPSVLHAFGIRMEQSFAYEV